VGFGRQFKCRVGLWHPFRGAIISGHRSGGLRCAATSGYHLAPLPGVWSDLASRTWKGSQKVARGRAPRNPWIHAHQIIHAPRRWCQNPTNNLFPTPYSIRSNPESFIPSQFPVLAPLPGCDLFGASIRRSSLRCDLRLPSDTPSRGVVGFGLPNLEGSQMVARG